MTRLVNTDDQIGKRVTGLVKTDDRIGKYGPDWYSGCDRIGDGLNGDHIGAVSMTEWENSDNRIGNTVVTELEKL